MKRVLTCALSLALAGLLSIGAMGMSGTPYAPGAAHDQAGAAGANQAGTDDPNLAMTVRFDYDDQVRVGVALPAFIDIANKGPAVDGILRLSVTPRDSDEALVYEMPVHVDQEAKASFTLPFRTPIETRNIRVHLLRGDKVLAEAGRVRKYVTFTQDMLLGVLSDNPDGMTYRGALDAIMDDDATKVAVKPVDLTAADFPQQSYMLDRFALIVLNHFDLGHLSEEQKNALIAWMKDGGRLLVDADTTNAQALQSLKPLVDLTVTGEATSEEAAGELAATAKVDAAQYTEARLQNLGKVEPAGKQVVGTADCPLVTEYPVGKGKVFATAFALNDPLLLRELPTDFLFANIRGLSAWNNQQVQSRDYNYSTSINSHLKDAVKSIEWLDAPSIVWILVMLLGFIVIAAPVSYILLSKRDKRDWIWFTAPGLALVCCAIIIGYGVGRHGVQTVSSIVTVVDSREDVQAERAYSLVGIAAPRQGGYELRMEEDSFPYRLPNRDYYYYYNDDADQELWPAGRPTVRVDVSGYPTVSFQEIRQWSMDTFYIRRDLSVDGALYSDIQYHAKGARYTVRNNTGHALEDVTVVSQLGCRRIPFLEAGEEKSGDIEPYAFMQNQSGAAAYSPYYGYSGGAIDFGAVVNELYNRGSSYYRISDEEDTRTEDEKREDYLKSRMVNAFLESAAFRGQSSTYGVQGNAAVWAWSRELGAMPITANGKEVRNDLNRAIVLGGADVSYEDNGELLIPLGQISGVIVDAADVVGSANYGEYSAYFSDGEVTFVFDLPIAASSYQIDHMVLSASYSYGNFTALLYNNGTDDWDRIDFDMELRGGAVKDYIDTDGRVLLKITTEVDDDDMDYSYGSEVNLDYITISVAGKK